MSHKKLLYFETEINKMWKHVTGIHDDAVEKKEEIRKGHRNARQFFTEYTSHFEAKKNEEKGMKRKNEALRSILREEAKLESSFKSTTMKKRAAFLPSLN